jgi:hypothetical protein
LYQRLPSLVAIRPAESIGPDRTIVSGRAAPLTEAKLDMKSLPTGPAADVVGPEDATSPPRERPVGTGEGTRPRPSRSRWSGVRWVLILLLGLGTIGGSVAWIRARRAVERDAKAARTALQSGRTAAARAALLRWLGARPSSADAHALMAELALAEGDFARVKH